jgi:hypothetical protein
MYGNMRSDRFARLYTYEQAKRHFHSIKPYTKGRNKGLSPFAERSRHWLTMRQEGEDYVITLYRTDIIRFKPDGRMVVKQGGWDTPTTHEVIGRVLGTEIFIRDHKGWITARREGRSEVGCYVLHKEDECVFKRGSIADPNSYGTGLVYLNPPVPVIHKLNRSKYEAIKKEYKPFINYAKRMAKLLNDECRIDDASRQGVEVVSYFDSALCRAMREDWESNPYGVWIACVDKTMRNIGHFYRTDGHTTWADINRTILEAIKTVHAGGIFDRHEMLDAGVVRNTNRKYIYGL